MLPRSTSIPVVHTRRASVNEATARCTTCVWRPWLLDDQKPAFWRGAIGASVQQLTTATADFVRRMPEAAPLVAERVPPTVLSSIRFGLAADSSALTCRLFWQR